MNRGRRGGPARTLLVVAVVLAGVFAARAFTAMHKPATVAEPVVSVSAIMPDQSQGAPVAVTPPPAPTGPSPTASALVVGSPWEAVGVRFITAYTDTTGGRDAWLARLKPVVSSSVYTGLTQTDLARLPGGTPGPGVVRIVNEAVGGVVRYPLAGGSVWGVDVTVGVTSTGTLCVTRFLPVASAGAP